MFTVKVVLEMLSDGSEVFNVILSDEVNGTFVKLHANSEGDAVTIAGAIARIIDNHTADVVTAHVDAMIGAPRA